MNNKNNNFKEIWICSDEIFSMQKTYQQINNKKI